MAALDLAILLWAARPDVTIADSQLLHRKRKGEKGSCPCRIVDRFRFRCATLSQQPLPNSLQAGTTTRLSFAFSVSIAFIRLSSAGVVPA